MDRLRASGRLEPRNAGAYNYSSSEAVQSNEGSDQQADEEKVLRPLTLAQRQLLAHDLSDLTAQGSCPSGWQLRDETRSGGECVVSGLFGLSHLLQREARAPSSMMTAAVTSSLASATGTDDGDIATPRQ